MPQYVTARFQVRPESLDVCLRAIEKFVAAVKANEPRTRMYVSWQDQDDPTQFLHMFVFEDAAAEEAHRVTPWVKAFVETLYPQLASDGVEFRHYSVAATTQ